MERREEEPESEMGSRGESESDSVEDDVERGGGERDRECCRAAAGGEPDVAWLGWGSLAKLTFRFFADFVRESNLLRDDLRRSPCPPLGVKSVVLELIAK